MGGSFGQMSAQAVSSFAGLRVKSQTHPNADRYTVFCIAALVFAFVFVVCIATFVFAFCISAFVFAFEFVFCIVSFVFPFGIGGQEG